MSTVASTGAAASTGTASTGSASTGGSTAAAMGWPDDWRNRFAAGSTDLEKELKQVERYESPEQIWKKARELEKKMSSGELRTTLRKDATAQEVAQWRKDNGIPEKPEGYKITMPAGRDAPKEDDAFLKAFLKSAHDSHYTQGQVDNAIGVFYAEVDRQEKAVGAAEAAAKQATDEKLRAEWGKDYTVNKNMAEALLSRAPSGFRDRFLNGYLADHTPISASPDAWKWLVQLEREINPASTVLPNIGAATDKGLADRINELKAMMGNKQSAYWKGPKADDLQSEYRALLEQQDKMRARGQAQAA